ncbi:NUDIX hydrolase [Brevundimonas sp.]|uniref:NUDIX hydrolase n=1 Tax=Brevundimonas sp. TaxID=1871086 RepID=UPI00343D5D47
MANREVLLVEPLNHFGGYGWTFPKGRPNPGENPAKAALGECSKRRDNRPRSLRLCP